MVSLLFSFQGRGYAGLPPRPAFFASHRFFIFFSKDDLI